MNRKALVEKCVNQLFEDQVKKNKEKKAILYGETYVTYQMLDEKSNQVAQLLVQNQIQKEERVAILMNRSPETIIIMLGIIKAGGCYVPIHSHTPYLRIQAILNVAEAKFLVTSSEFTENIIKICRNNRYLKKCILVDTENSEEIIYQEGLALVGTNHLMWNQVVKESTNMVNAAGWVHKDSGIDFNESEMEEYKENVKSKLMPYLDKDKNILEIGCGSGLLMFELASFVKQYTGIDFADEVIKKNEEYIKQHHILNVSVEQMNAHEIGRLEKNSYDIVIMNSVVQYFPCIDYLQKILYLMEQLVKDSGIIFIGDIRDKEKQDEYYVSLLKNCKKSPCEEKRYVYEKLALENELFIKKSYLKKLEKKEGAVTKVEITKKLGIWKNELLKYRYDALLHIDKKKGRQKGIMYERKFYLDQQDIKRQAITLPNVKVGSFDLMYIMFTSGSTGEPKGVMIEHHSVVNMLESFYKRCDFIEKDMVLCLTNFCFDISVLEIFLTLCKGLTIALVGTVEYDSPLCILKTIKEKAVTVLQITPSRFKQLSSIKNADEDLKTVRIVLIGGEILDEHCVQYIKNNMNCNLYNVYGPTETTVWSTCQKINNSYVTIGKPIDNTEIYILNGDNEIETGSSVGEIIIAGGGLARGYIHDPVLTKEKFTDEFFIGGKRVYRTGDLGKYDGTGNIIFMGRLDRQVKINGNRIEIDEIESVLNHHMKIQNSAVMVIEDDRGKKFIVAYYTTSENIEEAEVKAYLEEFLPSYMIPSYLIAMSEIPLNASGKIDRKKLLEPIQYEDVAVSSEPVDEIEDMIITIWKQLLGQNNIGIDSNFFRLGGDSLSCTQMIAMIYMECNVDLAIKDILFNCTVRTITEQIRREVEGI